MRGGAYSMAGAGAEPGAAVRLWAALGAGAGAHRRLAAGIVAGGRRPHAPHAGGGDRSVARRARGAAAVVAVCTGDAAPRRRVHRRRRGTRRRPGRPPARMSFAPAGGWRRARWRVSPSERTPKRAAIARHWKPTRRTASTMRGPPRPTPPPSAAAAAPRAVAADDTARPSPPASTRRCSWRRAVRWRVASRRRRRRRGGDVRPAGGACGLELRPIARSLSHARQPLSSLITAASPVEPPSIRATGWGAARSAAPSAGWSVGAGFSRRAAAGACSLAAARAPPGRARSRPRRS